MATSKISATEGSGKNIATHSISEDAVTKELQRVVPSTSAGAEIAPATAAQIGEVQASPTANTVLDRLKALLTGIVLAAGSAIIGKVGIDQTTPGTTNKVSIGTDGTVTVNSLPAGNNNIGDVDVASIAAGDNNIGNVDVVTLPALPTGTNSIGQVTANPSKLPTTDDAEFVRKYYTNAGAVTDGIVWSPAAGKRWYVTDIIVNTSAAATITFEDDKAGGDDPVLKLELAANGGLVSNFKTPLASGEDAADLLVTTSAGNIYICVIGYEV